MLKPLKEGRETGHTNNQSCFCILGLGILFSSISMSNFSPAPLIFYNMDTSQGWGAWVGERFGASSSARL